MGLLAAALNAQDLGKGGFEVRASWGIVNAGNGIDRVISPTIGVEGAFGLSRIIALTAGYTHDSLHDPVLVTCRPFLIPPPKDCTSYEFQHEFMGGVRISAPNRTRITPHLQFALGAVRQTSTSSPASSATGKTEFGFGPGAGLDYKLTRHFGIGVDANYVKANSLPGFYHVTGSVFFRF